MAVIEASDKNFDEAVQNGYSMVDFYGDHCGACVFTAPHFREAADDMALVNFVKVNTSVYPEMAARFGIKALPTFIYFLNGKEIRRKEGGMNLEMIRAELAETLYRS